MAFTVEKSVVIDKPIEEVWTYVAHEDAWRRPIVTDVRPLDEGPPEAGSRYEDHFVFAGKKGTVVNELIDVDEPHSMSWFQPEGQGGPSRVIEGSYELEDLDGKTRFTLRNTYEANGLWKLARPLLQMQMERTIYPRMLSQLKEQIEGGRSPEQDA